MAVTPYMTFGEIKHVMGDQFIIPVTLELKDGVTTVFSHSEDVEHKTSRSISESINDQQVKNKFQSAVNDFLAKEKIKAKTEDINNALNTLKASISLTGEKK